MSGKAGQVAERVGDVLGDVPGPIGDVIDLSPAVVKLIEEIKDAVSATGAGGKKITRQEARRIVRAALALVPKLLDVLL